MKGDNSRETFSREKHYSAVREQQGRAQLDANWNEQVAIQQYLDRTEATDVIGPVGVPEGDTGFAISFNTNNTPYPDLRIDAGRMYVEGILCEQDLSPTFYSRQPHLSKPPFTKSITVDGSERLILDIGTGDQQLHPNTAYTVYADVWERHVSWIEDPSIREVALGGADTASRSQVIWQVKIAPKDVDFRAAEEATMSARISLAAASSNLCDLSPTAGYGGLENQLYRVEVHEGGRAEQGNTPTFKWSRDNGSVAGRWVESIANANTVRVEVAGGTVSERFQAGNWIELTGDARDLDGRPGVLAQVRRAYDDLVEYDPASVVTPKDLTLADARTIPTELFGASLRVRRWDGYGDIAVSLYYPGNEDQFWLPLEERVEVHFWAFGGYRSPTYYPGQYWLIPARTITHAVEWPCDPNGYPTNEPARGIRHHYAVLAELTVKMDGTSQKVEVIDRRPFFCPLTRVSCEGSAELPLPGQYRCYLVDCDKGDDDKAVVGIGDSAEAALANAKGGSVPFRSITGVAKRMPRTGNDSIAMVLIGRGTGEGKGEYHESPQILGLSGYRHIVIRGSDFSNDSADKANCCARAAGTFQVVQVTTVSDYDPYSRRTFGASPYGAIQVPSDWRGARLTFVPNPWTGEQGRAGQTLTIQAVESNDAGSYFTMTVLETIETPLQGGVDYFKIEVPNIQIDSLKLQVNASDARSRSSGGQDGVVLAGLKVATLELSGMAGVGLSFVQAAVNAITSPLLSLQMSPDYQDESGAYQSTSCAGSIHLWSYGTDFVSLNRAVLNSVNVYDCDSLRISECMCREVLTLNRCNAMIDRGALGGISWNRCTGTIQNVTALCEQLTFFITVYESDCRLYVSGITGGVGTGGIWLRFSGEARNCEVVFGDVARLTDILMTDNAPYDPRYLAVSDIRDGNGNHVQGEGGCVVSSSGVVMDLPGSLGAFRLIAIKNAPTSGSPTLGSAEPELSQPPLEIIGVTQNYTVGDTGGPKVRVLTSGLVPIALAEENMVPPVVVYLADAGRIGLNRQYQRIGIMVAKRTSSGYQPQDVGIVALGR